MKYRVCVNNKNFNVLLEEIYPDPAHEIEVEVGYNRHRTKILSWNRELGITSILIDDVPYDVEMIRNERGELEAVKIDNQVFSIEEVQAGKLLTTRREHHVVKEGVVKAFMPGLIVRVLKRAGEEVQEGETVLFMEAMKMENAIVAPRSGNLNRLNCVEGDAVLTGDLLFVVE
jgi:biotin carboxyl carrier protein